MTIDNAFILEEAVCLHEALDRWPDGDITIALLDQIRANGILRWYSIRKPLVQFPKQSRRLTSLSKRPQSVSRLNGMKDINSRLRDTEITFTGLGDQIELS